VVTKAYLKKRKKFFLKQENNLKWHLKILIAINILVGLGMLGAYFAPIFSPREYWFFAFLGLAFPFLLAINLLFCITWLLLKKYKISLMAISLLLPGIPHIPAYLQLNPKEKPQTEGVYLNIVDFNTHYMGAYDFIGKDSNYFFSMLDTLKPDIICLQEFTNLGGYQQKPMFKRFSMEYKSYANYNADILSKTYPTGYGVCIFSKYPIIKKGFVERVTQSSNLSVFADIVVGEDTIRVINTHLKSIVFDRKDYWAVEQMASGEDLFETDDIRRIIAKLKYAFKERAKQADYLRSKIDESPYKVIICGDFNDSPMSYSYRTLQKGLKDAFIESGYGMSRTYIGKMPSFRIDYILHDKAWHSYNYKTNKLNFSDHKMISCTIKVR
jgi:endonuclease/exonuclease/phosphatase family metal-dependent hydrolase